MTDLREGFRNWLRPERTEERTAIDLLDGEIPREIHGTLFRNGPSQNVLPAAGAQALHLFDGDAYINAFRFEDGEVRHDSAFARTESFEFEEKQGRYCMPGGAVAADVALEDAPRRVQPNTNIVMHAGRLLALVENAEPFELDPQTLASIGPWTLDGRMLSYSTTAHPKIDGRTGEMWIHGYSPFEPFLQLYAVSPDGAVTLAEPVDAPYATMMHDVAITENHVIFPLCPVLLDGDVLVSGRPYGEAFRWDPERPIRFGVRERRAGAETRWFEAPEAGFMFHFGSAWEQGSRLRFDACVYRDGGKLVESLQRIRGGEVGGFAAPPVAFEIDLASGAVSADRFDDQGAEFPRIDDRRVGYENRWVYAAVSNEGGKELPETTFSTLVKYDRSGGPTTHHHVGKGRWAGEPIFVPRTPDADEDDGFILCNVYDAADDASELLILDARNFASAPLARARLRHRVPFGFHGNFAAAR